MGNGTALCSLCFCTIWHQYFEEVNGSTKEMSDIVFANRDFSLTKGQPICYTCSGKIKDSFNFKCMCICTEDFLAPFSSAETITQNILKEAHMKKYGKRITDIEIGSVCRLCLQLIKENFSNCLERTELDVIQKCISEMTILRTLNPIACNACTRSLNNYASFVRDCLTTQEQTFGISICTGEKQCENLMSGVNCHLNKGENYAESFPPSMHSPIQIPKQEDINAANLEVSFSDSNQPTIIKIEVDNQSNTLYDLDLHMVRQTDLHHKNPFKAEMVTPSPKNICQGTVRKPKKPLRTKKTHTCEECDYQTTYLNALKSHKLNHMELSDIHMYQCGKCDYKTKHKYALKSHELNHKPPSEIKMRKCNQCPYETKHRTALVLHMLKHTSPDEILMYKCDRCQFQTKFKHALKPHKLKHKKET